MQNDASNMYEVFVRDRVDVLRSVNHIKDSQYSKYEVKRGLRNPDGTGVMAGVTHIGNVRGYYMQDGEKMPMEGQLIYRGYDVNDLVDDFLKDDRFGYEETAYLLLFGELPTKDQLADFSSMLRDYMVLPDRFTEDMILAAPSRNIMNKLERSMLSMYSYDPDPEPEIGNLEKELHQAIHLIARCPCIVAHAYAAKRHYFDNESLYLHRPQPDLSFAENFLYSVRPDNSFTDEEAKLLDLCLVLHAEHGGGNNSAFACRVLSSTGTDIYSAIAAAVGSLKGPRHGGANKAVMDMFDYIQRDVANWRDEDEVADCVKRIMKREGGDGSGLIYGMGHAVYTLSDPRTKILKSLAKDLAARRGLLEEFELVELVEKLTPQVFEQLKGVKKIMCANVDMYSGLIYKMLGIPEDLYTPMFAIARIVGWCAHRIEEVYNSGKIMRPAYKAVSHSHKFVPMEER